MIQPMRKRQRKRETVCSILIGPFDWRGITRGVTKAPTCGSKGKSQLWLTDRSQPDLIEERSAKEVKGAFAK